MTSDRATGIAVARGAVYGLLTGAVLGAGVMGAMGIIDALLSRRSGSVGPGPDVEVLVLAMIVAAGVGALAGAGFGAVAGLVGALAWRRSPEGELRVVRWAVAAVAAVAGTIPLPLVYGALMSAGTGSIAAPALGVGALAAAVGWLLAPRLVRT